MTTPCVTLPSTTGGYVRRRINGKLVYMHRHVFEKAHRKLEPGETVDHICETKNCIEATHLQAVSTARNTQLRWVRKWEREGRHCPRNHAGATSGKTCVDCHRERQIKYRAQSRVT